MVKGCIYLVFALLSGLFKGFCGKLISNGANTFKEVLSVNIVRMFFCTLIGFGAAGLSGFSSLAIDSKTALVCLMSALCMTAFCVCWMFAYRFEAYMYLNIFTMMGAIGTCFFGLVVFGEPIKATRWIGMVILLIAVYIMTLYNKKLTGKMTFIEVVLLVAGALGSSLADFSQKIYTRTIGGDASVFNFYTYLFSLLILLVVTLFVKAPEKEKKEHDKKYFILCFVMSACLYINTLSKTFAASYLTTVQMYPTLQGANLIFSALMAHIFFKEKVTPHCVVGMICAFAGLIIMNVL